MAIAKENLRGSVAEKYFWRWWMAVAKPMQHDHDQNCLLKADWEALGQLLAR